MIYEPIAKVYILTDKRTNLTKIYNHKWRHKFHLLQLALTVHGNTQTFQNLLNIKLPPLGQAGRQVIKANISYFMAAI